MCRTNHIPYCSPYPLFWSAPRFLTCTSGSRKECDSCWNPHLWNGTTLRNPNTLVFHGTNLNNHSEPCHDRICWLVDRHSFPARGAVTSASLRWSTAHAIKGWKCDMELCWLHHCCVVGWRHWHSSDMVCNAFYKENVNNALKQHETKIIQYDCYF